MNTFDDPRSIGAIKVKVGELDSKAEQLQLREEQARVVALSGQLVAVRHRGTVEKQARRETGQGAPVALDEARARHQEAEAAARAARDRAFSAFGIGAQQLLKSCAF